MKFFTRHGRALLLAAVLAVGVFVYTAAAQTKGTFTDSRDGYKYKTVKIGGKTWMAQNLNYQTGNSWCYDDDNSNCDKYGRLYDWTTAKTACPKGWRLPSREDWNALVTAAGGNVAGKALKSTSGWNKNGNGTDEFGFSALPGGFRYYTGSTFGDAGNYGYWWTATGDSGGYAYDRNVYYGSDYVGEDGSIRGVGLSVRCVAD